MSSNPFGFLISMEFVLKKNPIQAPQTYLTEAYSIFKIQDHVFISGYENLNNEFFNPMLV